MAEKTTGGTATERTIFEADPAVCTTPRAKNDVLAKWLRNRWNTRAIVEIRRIEIGTPGWEILYRASGS